MKIANITGYEGLYTVSEDGDIFSIKTNKNLKPFLNANGYYIVCLCKNGKKITERIHRLVAESFISRIDGKPQVNHINGVRTDNCVQNLEWVTHQENVLHGWRSNGRQPSKKQRANGRRLAKMVNKKHTSHKMRITPICLWHCPKCNYEAGRLWNVERHIKKKHLTILREKEDEDKEIELYYWFS